MALTFSVSMVMFQTTKLPSPFSPPLIITKSSICTPFAQQAEFLSSLSSSVLSRSTIPPGSVLSTDTFEKDLECDCVQYGGEVMGERSGRSWSGVDSDVRELAAWRPFTSPLPFNIDVDSIH